MSSPQTGCSRSSINVPPPNISRRREDGYCCEALFHSMVSWRCSNLHSLIPLKRFCNWRLPSRLLPFLLNCSSSTSTRFHLRVHTFRLSPTWLSWRVRTSTASQFIHSQWQAWNGGLPPRRIG